MIVIEGADGVGKTTLANQIATATLVPSVNYDYVHLSILPPWWDAGKHYQDICSAHRVVDRFLWSELVYAEAYQRKTLAGADDPAIQQKVYEHMDRFRTVQILLWRSYTKIREDLEKTVQHEFVTVDRNKTVQEIYLNTVKEQVVPTLILNVNNVKVTDYDKLAYWLVVYRYDLRHRLIAHEGETGSWPTLTISSRGLDENFTPNASNDVFVPSSL